MVYKQLKPGLEKWAPAILAADLSLVLTCVAPATAWPDGLPDAVSLSSGFQAPQSACLSLGFPMGSVVSHTQWVGRGFPVHYGSAEDGPTALYILGMAAATEHASQAFKRPLLSQDPRNDLCLSREHRAETHSLQVRLCFTATFPEDSGKNIACCLVLLKNTICTALSLLSTETSKCHRRSLLAIVRPCGGGEEHSFTKQHMLGKVAFSLNQGSVDAIYSEKQTLTGRN